MLQKTATTHESDPKLKKAMAQAAVASTSAVLSSRSYRPYPFLFFLFSPTPNLSFSTSPHPSNRSNALRPMKPPASDGDSHDNEETGKTSNVAKNRRNELKRKARRAVRWGIELATFSPPQIKRILRAASLERGVLDAILLVKMEAKHGGLSILEQGDTYFPPSR